MAPVLALFWLVLAWLGFPAISFSQVLLDNETLYSNQDENTETRRSEHFRLCFGHFNRDTGTPITEQLVQGNLQMFEQMWHRWVVELGLSDINESATTPDGKKHRSNFNFLMSWNDGGSGGAFSSMDSKGFFYAMANSGYCRYDPPSGATPHEFGHVWEGTCGGFNGSDSSGAWWECTANWLQLQFLNSYPQAGGYIRNGMYYPAHGRDYYDSFMIWETALEDPRYGIPWINNVWTNANATQRNTEFIIDRMIRCDSSGSPDKAGAINDLWGDMAKKMVTWDFGRQRWLATANLPDDGSNWEFYQRSRTPLVKVPGKNGWYRPARAHLPMEFGFNFIPLSVAGGTTVVCHFQPMSDPVRQSDWRACLVAVNNAGEASYSAPWNAGSNAIALSADQRRCYLVVIATPKPMKIADPAWKAYLTDAGLQFPYQISFAGAVPKNVVYPVQSRAGMVQHPNGGGWKSTTAIVDPSAYVGSNAQVLDTAQVRGNARIEDFAVVRNNAQVRDNATVSGHAVVEANAKVYGSAKVRDWARVFGYAEVYENARIIEHANCGDGNATTHTRVYGNAIIKGTTYVYDPSTLAGCLIMDGDSANGNGTTPAIKGVHFGWAWGQDPARFGSLADNGYLYLQHTFEKDNPVFARDEFGINHGFLVNGCRSEVDTAAPRRGGRVLALNGTNQYVELHPSANDFRNSTFAVWMKWTAPTDEQCIWSFGDGASKRMSLTPRDPITGNLRFSISNGAVSHFLNGSLIPLNVWTHLVVVFSGSTCALYVNGMMADSISGTVFPDSLNAPLMENANYLGRGNDGNYFQGYLDDFRVYMKALSATEIAALYTALPPESVTVITDTTPPTPNAATWLVAPTQVGENAVTMSATPGTDASGWVEYYFDCTSGDGHDSGWVSFNKYTDAGLMPGVHAAYTVKMRDRSGNTTASSVPGAVTTASYPLPEPAFSYGPIGVANGNITMSATKPINPAAKVEYKFDRVAPSPATTGWQSSPTWTQTGLTAGLPCTYTVTIRDSRSNLKGPSAPAAALARDDDPPRLPIWLAHWEMLPYATIDNKVSMTAMVPSDAAGIEYRFHCVEGGGPDSPWQSSRNYVTPELPDGSYVYHYQTRDTSSQQNTSMYSTAYAARITPTTGYHSYSLSQVLTNKDDYLVSFPGTVVKVSTNSYSVRDLGSGATIKVRPGTSNQVTDAALALKNVHVKGHLYTFDGVRQVTYSAVSATGTPSLYTVSGKVTDQFGGAVTGATVHFSDLAGASSNTIVSATTDALGNYSRGLIVGTWFAGVSANAFNSSEDRALTIANAGISNLNFSLVANARVTGRVTRRSDGYPVSGASVYFSRVQSPSSVAVFTTVTDASGNYSQAVQDGIWHVSAGAANFYGSVEKTLAISGVDIYSIDFSLQSGTRSIPLSSNLLFSAVTESLPSMGTITSWPSYRPSGKALTSMGSPTVESSDGIKWVKNLADGPGFRQDTYSAPIPINGATIVVVAKPRRVPSNNWDSIVDIFYDRLVLGIRNDTGRVNVRRNGSLDYSSASVPEGQTTILSLVVQPNGQYKIWANGLPIYTNATLSPMTALTNGVAGPFANSINLGRNDPDGWTTFNGSIGDVFVYTNALSDTDRQIVEADLNVKFRQVYYSITATAGAGGTINPVGTVLVNPAGFQTFTLTPDKGFMITNLVVNGASRGVRNSWTFSNVDANHTIKAYFAPLPPPTLFISQLTSGEVEIKWLDVYSSDVLVSPVLGMNATWTNAGTPEHISNYYRLILVPGNGSSFYGLSR